MEYNPTTLTLPAALEAAGWDSAQLSARLGVASSTVWRWCSPDYRYRTSQPTAAQLSEIGEALRLGANEVRRLADWYRVRAQGGM